MNISEKFLKKITNDKDEIGLGTVIEKFTKSIGIKPCGGCKERAKKLNEKFKIVLKKRKENRL